MKKFAAFLLLGASMVCSSEAFGMIINVNKRTTDDICQKSYEEYCRERESINFLPKFLIKSESELIDEQIKYNENPGPNPRLKELKKFYKTNKTPKKPLKSSYKKWEE